VNPAGPGRLLAEAGLPRKTLTSDAAEALLLGLWAAMQAGWGKEGAAGPA